MAYVLLPYHFPSKIAELAATSRRSKLTSNLSWLVICCQGLVGSGESEHLYAGPFVMPCEHLRVGCMKTELARTGDNGQAGHARRRDNGRGNVRVGGLASGSRPTICHISVSTVHKPGMPVPMTRTAKVQSRLRSNLKDSAEIPTALSQPHHRSEPVVRTAHECSAVMVERPSGMPLKIDLVNNATCTTRTLSMGWQQLTGCVSTCFLDSGRKAETTWGRQQLLLTFAQVKTAS